MNVHFSVKADVEHVLSPQIMHIPLSLQFTMLSHHNLFFSQKIPKRDSKVQITIASALLMEICPGGLSPGMDAACFDLMYLGRALVPSGTDVLSEC